MSAFDTFDKFNSSLSHSEVEALKGLERLRRVELLAARSEDARMRLVERYIEEVHELLRPVK